MVPVLKDSDNATFGEIEKQIVDLGTKAKEGTIRKLYGISIDKNSVHGSDSPTNAKIEIDFFFK